MTRRLRRVDPPDAVPPEHPPDRPLRRLPPLVGFREMVLQLRMDQRHILRAFSVQSSPSVPKPTLPVTIGGIKVGDLRIERLNSEGFSGELIFEARIEPSPDFDAATLIEALYGGSQVGNDQEKSEG